MKVFQASWNPLGTVFHEMFERKISVYPCLKQTLTYLKCMHIKIISSSPRDSIPKFREKYFQQD